MLEDKEKEINSIKSILKRSQGSFINLRGIYTLIRIDNACYAIEKDKCSQGGCGSVYPAKRFDLEKISIDSSGNLNLGETQDLVIKEIKKYYREEEGQINAIWYPPSRERNSFFKKNDNFTARIGNKTYLFLEKIPGENINNILSKYNRLDSNLDYEKRISIIKELFISTNSLHNETPNLGNPYLHGDMKSGNIHVVLNDKNKSPDVYLLDFGFSIILENTDDSFSSKKLFGTPNNMPPESINKKYSLKSDIYSLTPVIIQILSGSPFREREKISKQYKKEEENIKIRIGNKKQEIRNISSKAKESNYGRNSENNRQYLVKIQELKNQIDHLKGKLDETKKSFMKNIVLTNYNTDNLLSFPEHKQLSVSIDTLIIDFLNDMMHHNPEKRPDSFLGLRFFNTLNQLIKTLKVFNNKKPEKRSDSFLVLRFFNTLSQLFKTSKVSDNTEKPYLKEMILIYQAKLILLSQGCWNLDLENGSSLESYNFEEHQESCLDIINLYNKGDFNQSNVLDILNKKINNHETSNHCLFLSQRDSGEQKEQNPKTNYKQYLRSFTH